MPIPGLTIKQNEVEENPFSYFVYK